jgi:uncharacterized protein YukE
LRKGGDILPLEEYQELVSVSLKNEIQWLLQTAISDLSIDSDIWSGESKVAYDNVVSSFIREIEEIAVVVKGI